MLIKLHYRHGFHRETAKNVKKPTKNEVAKEAVHNMFDRLNPEKDGYIVRKWLNGITRR
eukprot:m.62316 g.62316  ORF g.62316 m.62316 type:complete len:59 (+) comp35054_c0_seq7:620-796(+)